MYLACVAQGIVILMEAAIEYACLTTFTFLSVLFENLIILYNIWDIKFICYVLVESIDGSITIYAVEI